MRAHELVLTMFFLASCGPVSTGAPATPNDTAPTGTIVTQGSFTGLNSQTVTGAVVIYRASSTGTDIIRLEGISAPSESGLQVIGKANGQIIYRASLRNVQGTQNYNTGLATYPRWNSVSIFSSRNNKDYGSALLEMQNTSNF